ncbi:MAG: tRNA (N6-isopentenyl adenosine(37)-C2)-methylthiotransferase MiaB [Bacteroidales bacterium]
MNRHKVYLETYGCQMNIYDSEIALSLLKNEGYDLCDNMEESDLILVNTCSIRENAEKRIWGRLDRFMQEKKKRKVIIGVIGCMAERLGNKLLEHPAVDLAAGPDSYRYLPSLVQNVINNGEKQINIQLSLHETYEEIEPFRTDKNGVQAYISIMRGCNNMCTYCIVPYTRGRERSRDPHSIIRETKQLIKDGYKEVCLLGQNVDSYDWINPNNPTDTVNFAQLIEMVALVNPHLRIRYSTSHPKDMENGVLYSMAMYPNICSHIHLPVQSGSNNMLKKMNRKYTREQYLERIKKIKKIIPKATITTDILSGFCGETEQDHQDTLSLMREVEYDYAYMFIYSNREGTKASKFFKDDVPLKTKTRRLQEIIKLQNVMSLKSNQADIGKIFEILINGPSKKDPKELCGRTEGNKMCVFPAENHKAGDYVNVKIDRCTSATLMGKIVK